MICLRCGYCCVAHSAIIYRVTMVLGFPLIYLDEKKSGTECPWLVWNADRKSVV